jgi:NAD dependent epimerase/dehydratase family enzyme
MTTIANTKGGIKIPAPVPPFVLRIIMGEASEEVLKSCTVSSARVQGAGYVFSYPEIGPAIQKIVSD